MDPAADNNYSADTPPHSSYTAPTQIQIQSAPSHNSEPCRQLWEIQNPSGPHLQLPEELGTSLKIPTRHVSTFNNKSTVYIKGVARDFSNLFFYESNPSRLSNLVGKIPLSPSSPIMYLKLFVSVREKRPPLPCYI